MYRFILPAVKNHLLQGLPAQLDKTQIGHTFEGRPPAMAPSIYVSIHPQGRTNEYAAQLAMNFPFTVTITSRRECRDTAAVLPDLYFGVDDRPGVEEYVDMIIGQIHGGDNYRAIALANSIAEAIEARYPGMSGPQQTLQLLNESAPHPVTSDWWGGRHDDQNGLKVDITFGMNDHQQASQLWAYGNPLP